MSTLTFADTHNMVAFLEKPTESDGFHEIIDFLNANQIHYALTINPIIYTSCIEQFWATTKENTVNGERQLQALVDKKRVIITESSIRSDLHLADVGGIDCLPIVAIFEELAWMGREGKDFSGRVTPLFATMMVQATQDKGVDSGISTDSQQTPITTQPSSSRPQKKQSRRKQRKETEVPQDETHHDDSVPIPSNDPLLSGLQRLRKVGESSRVESFDDTKSLGAQEDASKQGGIKIVDETQGRLNDAEMFNIDDLHDDEVIVDMEVVECAPTIPITPLMEGVNYLPRLMNYTNHTPTNAPTTVIDELTLAQTLIEIKAAKPKVVTTAATTTTTRPKARGVVVQEPSEFRTTTPSPQASQPSKTKDKGKAIMIEPEVPLKRKDQVALDEEMTRNLAAQLQAKLIEEEKMERKKEEEANIALIESWENKQAMMEADRLLAERLQTREQEELTDEEMAKLFMEFMDRRRKHFATLRAQEKRNRPPTKA
ncbi:hypothetical protein Tco_0644219 [Tanacetum coccineum]